jgi:hypothetical protein
MHPNFARCSSSGGYGATIFVFDSCQRGGIEKQILNSAASKFNSSVQAFRSNFGSMKFSSANASLSRTSGGDELYYLDFPDGTAPEVITDFASNINLQTLTDVLANYGVSIDDSVNINAEVVAHIPQEPIRQALSPLVQEAKNYLYAKGVTDQEINELLIEENAEEIDLIPFVKHLIAIEEEQLSAKNTRGYFPFISQANAEPSFLQCGMAALGADALYALATVEPTTWTWALMKPAFKKVASRMLGPIGVAFAIVSFTTCMLGLGS